jgi:hypothetical protein
MGSVRLTVAESVANHCRLGWVWMIEQVGAFDVSLPAERWSIPRHGDHLKLENWLNFRRIHARVDQPRSHRMVHVLKPGVWQPYFCD